MDRCQPGLCHFLNKECSWWSVLWLEGIVTCLGHNFFEASNGSYLVEYDDIWYIYIYISIQSMAPPWPFKVFKTSCISWFSCYGDGMKHLCSDLGLPWTSLSFPWASGHLRGHQVKPDRRIKVYDDHDWPWPLRWINHWQVEHVDQVDCSYCKWASVYAHCIRLLSSLCTPKSGAKSVCPLVLHVRCACSNELQEASCLAQGLTDLSIVFEKYTPNSVCVCLCIACQANGNSMGTKTHSRTMLW